MRKFTSLSGNNRKAGKMQALLVSLLLFLHCLLISAVDGKLFYQGFVKNDTAAIQQNAFNVSMHINKTVNKISSMLAGKTALFLKSSGGREDNISGPAVTGESEKQAVILHSNTMMSVSQNADPSLLQGGTLSLYRAYSDPGDLSPGSSLPALFYFLIMLLFFSSSRKVYGDINSLFAYKRTGFSA